ncbi:MULTISPECIES: FadR/GntR family transcriptional regulator [Providencia]|uniref:FadR/GntR family transcriptional regulator n=1 Tax=Providencia huashanensis TaxID=3037798 RepID=A0AA42FKW2_9GAMM|nr:MULTISPECIES: FadR/GntR family transcriptional regulator [Providencia]EIL1983845.1 FadR family transcriptional regulator [Providencia rettgeri]EIU9515136.1 FadR family transcriptional regulator [Providencia rettgeri]EJD6399198.1 FadR family transcriptional regulator [Providencia rettgeri]EJD6409550.1 FadR family transcriptional regulator [Providencia rettgeri]EJD6582092.1 FadR family transcriptional regulator [Providencia rettgeri]
MAEPQQTLAQSIMQQIGMQIILGYYKDNMLPGENELAQQFSASRTSIRNALQQLSSKGLISIQPKKRSVINPRDEWNFLDYDLLKWVGKAGVSPELFKQLVVLRLMFEPNASALAANFATGADLADLEKAWFLMQKGHEQDSLALFEQGDIDFHYALLKACHNPFLFSIGNAIQEALILSFKHTQEKSARETTESVKMHKLLFDAIRLKDSHNAKKLMKEIILTAATRHFPNLDQEKYLDILDR